MEYRSSLNRVDRSISGIPKDLKGIEGAVKPVSGKIESMLNKFNPLQGKMDDLLKKFNPLTGGLGNVDQTMKTIPNRVKRAMEDANLTVKTKNGGGGKGKHAGWTHHGEWTNSCC